MERLTFRSGKKYIYITLMRVGPGSQLKKELFVTTINVHQTLILIEENVAYAI